MSAHNGTSVAGQLLAMADLGWTWPKKIERDLIERTMTLDFIGRDAI